MSIVFGACPERYSLVGESDICEGCFESLLAILEKCNLVSMSVSQSGASGGGGGGSRRDNSPIFSRPFSLQRRYLAIALVLGGKTGVFGLGERNCFRPKACNINNLNNDYFRYNLLVDGGGGGGQSADGARLQEHKILRRVTR